MTDQPNGNGTAGVSADAQADPVSLPAGGQPAVAGAPAPHVPAPAAERPEVAVGAAFGGGLLLALLLRKVRS